MNIKPFGRNIYFTPNKEHSIIQTSSERLTDTGNVIAIGDDVKTVRVGNKIAFNGYGAGTVKINDIDCNFIREDDEILLCIYEME